MSAMEEGEGEGEMEIQGESRLLIGDVSKLDANSRWRSRIAIGRLAYFLVRPI